MKNGIPMRGDPRHHAFAGVRLARALTLLVVIAKLLLVATNEIPAVPFDAWSYVWSADSPPWRVLGPDVGYPMWLWLAHQSGVPQRIAIEGAYLGATVLLSWGLGWRVAGLPGYLLVLVLTAFSPASYFFLDAAMSDGLFACITLAAVGLGTAVLTSRRTGWRHWVALVVIGLLFGALEVTRKESPLVFFALTMLGVAFVALERVAGYGWLRSAGRAAARAGVVLFALESIVFSVELAHEDNENVWALSMAAMPSHTGLLTRLAAIDDGGPPLRFVPITRRALLAAYAASPTLRRFQPAVEAPDNPYLRESERWLGMRGQIGAGWVWHIFNAAGQSLGLRHAAQLDATYRRINGELDEAFAAQRLHKRFVLHPLIGADPSVWLRFVPASVHNVLRAVRTPTQPVIDEGYDAALFDRVLLRRAALTNEAKGVIAGWAYASNGAVVAVAVASSPTSDAVETQREERSELRTAYAAQGVDVPLMSGFRASLPISARGDDQLRFDVDGQTVVTSAALRTGQVQSLPLNAGGDHVVFAVDRLPIPGESTDAQWRRDFMRFGLAQYGRVAFWAMVPIVVIAALVLLGMEVRRKHPLAVGRLATLLLVAGWVLARLGLYVVVDAAAWGAEPRYVQLAGMMATALFASSVALLVQRAWPRFLGLLNRRRFGITTRPTASRQGHETTRFARWISSGSSTKPSSAGISGDA